MTTRSQNPTTPLPWQARGALASLLAARCEIVENPSDEADVSNTERGAPDGLRHVRAVRSEDLLQGSRELLILHGSEIYRLLRTRNNKLILQK